MDGVTLPDFENLNRILPNGTGAAFVERIPIIEKYINQSICQKLFCSFLNQNGFGASKTSNINKAETLPVFRKGTIEFDWKVQFTLNAHRAESKGR